MKVENTLRCLIVDDEVPAHEVLSHYSSQTPYLKIVAHAHNAMEALDLLRKNEVDILFLDIEMPGLSGIELLSALTNRPAVIITSAYSQYAIKGFDLNVCDYLLKPFSFQRYLQAIEKAGAPSKQNSSSEIQEDIWVKISDNWIKISIHDIDYVQSYGNYTKLFLTGKKQLLVNSTTAHFEENLPSPPFLRVHKSYLVNMKKISSINLNSVRISEIEIPIGRTYKGYVKTIFHEWR